MSLTHLARDWTPLSDIYLALVRDLGDAALARCVLHAAFLEGAIRGRMVRVNAAEGLSFVEQDLEPEYWSQMLFVGTDNAMGEPLHSDDRRWYFVAKDGLNKILTSDDTNDAADAAPLPQSLNAGVKPNWHAEVTRLLRDADRNVSASALARVVAEHYEAHRRAPPNFDNLRKFIGKLKKTVWAKSG